jgi:hypothetical protein
VPEINVKLSLTQEEALQLAKKLARDPDVREQVARDPIETLKGYGIEITGDVSIKPMIPPRHVFEDALLNIEEASEFASDAGFKSDDMFAYWLFVVFVAT